ncbi:alpha/beta fold hydrolase [Mycolicibacterium sp. P9-64]|uniref:alpha/beta fold hydrolase n=1 Tax=Mycolicibacterium sp. P9-64 TaxID=2024612 RepID=UPI001F5B739E|nr:alpha/beta fold hydrolase [Mycolicibacterium sp. P9-64]
MWRSCPAGQDDLAQAVADLEAIRTDVGAESWTVRGHSWGSDLVVRYVLDHPDRVSAVIGVAGHGLHEDRIWSAPIGRYVSSPRRFRVDGSWRSPVSPTTCGARTPRRGPMSFPTCVGGSTSATRILQGARHTVCETGTRRVPRPTRS